MIISIVGWYGTETMGDKAIFDGILFVFNKIYPNAHIQVGSLYPFYSERTFIEEKDVFKQTAPNMTFSIFDMKNGRELIENIRRSNIVIFGGGPLMDLEELFLIKYSFEVAQKKDIPCIIMGAGIGPLKQEIYIKIVEDIIKLSNLVILRDSKSVDLVFHLYNLNNKIIMLPDPAIISIENYKKTNIRCANRNIIVNFRDYSENVYSKRLIHNKVLWRELIFALKDIADKVYFMPMHNFYIGEDDRHCIASILDGEDIDGFEIFHSPINLHTMYSLIMNAYACVGMRYHSVVMQTILNGNNLIIDYTGAKEGKIYGFLSDVDTKGFYANRRYCMDYENTLNIKTFIKPLNDNLFFECPDLKTEEKYIKILKDYI